MSPFRRCLRCARFEQSLRFARNHFSHKATTLHKSRRIVPTSDVSMRLLLYNASWKYYQLKRFYCSVLRNHFTRSKVNFFKNMQY